MSYMDHKTAFAPVGEIQELSWDEIDQVGGGPTRAEVLNLGAAILAGGAAAFGAAAALAALFGVAPAIVVAFTVAAGLYGLSSAVLWGASVIVEWQEQGQPQM